MNPVDYAQAARLAYHKPPDIGNPGSASRAIIQTLEGETVIAFPGSNNLACWLADMDVLIRDVPGMGFVHVGFHDAWKKIADGVAAKIGEQRELFLPATLSVVRSRSWPVRQCVLRENLRRQSMPSSRPVCRLITPSPNYLPTIMLIFSFIGTALMWFRWSQEYFIPGSIAGL